MESIIGYIITGVITIGIGLLWRKLDKQEKKDDQRYMDKAKQDTLVLENLNANGKLTKLNSKLVIKCMLEENLNGEVNDLEEAIKYQTEVSHALDDHIREVSQRRRD
jgi:hypothetical protein